MATLATTAPTVERTPASPTRRRLRFPGRVAAIQLATVVVVLGGWELAARSGFVDPLFTSMPSDIVPAVGEVLTASTTPTDVWYTIVEVLVGFSIGSLLGVGFGLVLGLSDSMRRAFQPILNAVNAVPRIALVPLFVAWFGLGMAPRIVMAVTIVFFMMVTSVVTAISSPDRDLALLAKSLGASRRRRIQKFLLPGAIPVIATGLELSMIYSFLGVIAAEIVSGSNGLGSRMTYHANLFEADKFFAVLIVLTVIVTSFTALIRLVEKRLLRWHVFEKLAE